MKRRDAIRFVAVLIALTLIHFILFREVDENDMTQFWIAAAAYTIVCAIRERRPSHSEINHG